MNRLLIAVFFTNVLSFSVFAVEPGFWSGCWEGGAEPLLVRVEISKMGDTGILMVNGDEKSAAFSYGYAKDGINPIFTFYDEEEGDYFLVNYAYFVPGRIEGHEVLVGFFEQSKSIVPEGEIIKSVSHYLILEEVSCRSKTEEKQKRGQHP